MSKESGDDEADMPLEAGRVKVRLNALFTEIVNPATGEVYTNAEVARATGISASAIAQLRQGTKPNPTLKTIERLAEHFGVTAAYFAKQMSSERQRRIVAALKMLEAAERAGVEGVFARASELSADGLRTVTAIIDVTRRAEGLDGGN